MKRVDRYLILFWLCVIALIIFGAASYFIPAHCEGLKKLSDILITLAAGLLTGILAAIFFYKKTERDHKEKYNSLYGYLDGKDYDWYYKDDYIFKDEPEVKINTKFTVKGNILEFTGIIVNSRNAHIKETRGVINMDGKLEYFGRGYYRDQNDGFGFIELHLSPQDETMYIHTYNTVTDSAPEKRLISHLGYIAITSKKVKMNKNELTEYRNALSKEFVDKDLEIENSLSYISAGALGFFITINDKFLKIKEANCKLLIIISLCLIFVSFILILIRKSRTRSHAYKMIRFVDKMKPESYDDDVNLSDLWKESHKELNCIRLWVYITLGTGIGLQILFLSLNYF